MGDLFGAIFKPKVQTDLEKKLSQPQPRPPRTSSGGSSGAGGGSSPPIEKDEGYSYSSTTPVFVIGGGAGGGSYQVREHIGGSSIEPIPKKQDSVPKSYDEQLSRGLERFASGEYLDDPVIKRSSGRDITRRDALSQLAKDTYTQSEWDTYLSQKLGGIESNIETARSTRESLLAERGLIDPSQMYTVSYEDAYGRGEKTMSGTDLLGMYGGYVSDVEQQIPELEQSYFDVQHLRQEYGADKWHPETYMIKTTEGYELRTSYPGAEKYSMYEQKHKENVVGTSIASAFSGVNPLGIPAAYYMATGQRQKALDVQAQFLHQIDTIKEAGGILTPEFASFWFESPITQIGIAVAGGHAIGQVLTVKASVAAATTGKMAGSLLGKGIATGIMVGGAGMTAYNLSETYKSGDMGRLAGQLGVLGFQLAGGYAGYKMGQASGKVIAETKIGAYFDQHPEQIRFHHYRIGERVSHSVSGAAETRMGTPIETGKFRIKLTELYKPGGDIVASTTPYRPGVQEYSFMRSVKPSSVSMDVSSSAVLQSKIELDMLSIGKGIVDVPTGVSGIERTTMWGVNVSRAGLPLGGIYETLQLPIAETIPASGSMYIPVTSFVPQSSMVASVIGLTSLSSVTDQIVSFEKKYKPVFELDTIQTPRFDVIQSPVFELLQEPVFDVVQTPLFDVVQTPRYDVSQAVRFDVVQTPRYDLVQTPKYELLQKPSFEIKPGFYFPFLPGGISSGGAGGGWSGSRKKKSGARKRVHPVDLLFKDLFGR